ncbi:hypothetical protein M1116_00050 [Patescibacteria group bacterium]|nr:hypothetical protein [Patescibacteria group bacterium]
MLRLPLPEIASIDPNNICQLRCPLCPTGSGTIKITKSMISLDKFRLYVNRIPSLKKILLHGWGEPFLNHQLFD